MVQKMLRCGQEHFQYNDASSASRHGWFRMTTSKLRIIGRAKMATTTATDTVPLIVLRGFCCQSVSVSVLLAGGEGRVQCKSAHMARTYRYHIYPVCFAIILALQSWELPQYMSNFQCLSFRFFCPGFTVDVARQLGGALSLIRLPWRPHYGPGGFCLRWEDKAQNTQQAFQGSSRLLHCIITGIDRR
ncbi:unnamed protein product [Ixodes pacificus]